MKFGLLSIISNRCDYDLFVSRSAQGGGGGDGADGGGGGFDMGGVIKMIGGVMIVT